MKPSYTLYLLCLLTLPFLPIHGQYFPDNRMDTIVQRIADKGYENIRANQCHDTLFLGVENRVWRWEPRAVAEILKLVMPVVDTNTVVSLTLLHTGIPVTTVIVSRKQVDQLLNGQVSTTGFSDSVVALLSDHEYRASLGHLRPVKPSFNKFDVVVFPQLRAQFGNFDQPLEIQFNVAPAVKISFLKGMSLTAQVIFPIYNNLIGDPEGNTIRPGLLLLSQAFRLPGQFFTTVSAGYFTRNRYGFSGEVRKFFFNGKLNVGGTIGITGSTVLREGVFYYTPIHVFTWFCDAAWRFARYNLTIRAGYGGFIDRDQGWRVDVARQFGEVSVGFFAMQTGGLMNGGFNFIVPLPPRKVGTRNRIRIRPAPYVPWEYRAKGLPSQGRMFTTGSGTEELMFGMNPDYIRTHLGKQILINNRE